MYIQIAILAVMIGGITFALNRISAANPPPPLSLATTTKQVAGAAALATTSPQTASTTPSKKPPPAKKASIKATKSPVESTSSAQTVTRIDIPYGTSALSFNTVNDLTRATLVNILCTTSSGLVRPISGSGVIIDPRGIVLTNAHVAQYVLLSQSSRLDLQCYIRTGSPAFARYIPQVLYIPPIWIRTHASEIKSTRPLGTGEHDYALLYIAATLDGSPRPVFSALLPDIREAIGFIDDNVLVASYPAEFLGGLAATNDLYAVGSVTTIKQLLTFNTNSVDVMSLGGVIEAQSGSSGGPVVNAWARLIGIISTTSDAPTTADRDLRAVTMGYINRDLQEQTGFDLLAILGGDPEGETKEFATRAAPKLIQVLLSEIVK